MDKMGLGSPGKNGNPKSKSPAKSSTNQMNALNTRGKSPNKPNKK